MHKPRWGSIVRYLHRHLDGEGAGSQAEGDAASPEVGVFRKDSVACTHTKLQDSRIGGRGLKNTRDRCWLHLHNARSGVRAEEVLALA